jgi:hypothetical protein
MEVIPLLHHSPGKTAGRVMRCTLAAMALLGGFSDLGAQSETPSSRPQESQFLPAPVTEGDFSAMKEHSPFRRTVGLSDSIVLTGMARIEENLFATLVDTETREAHLVSRFANSMGWQLVGVRGDEDDLESLTAKILVTGGDVVSIRYEKLAPRSSKSGSGSSSGGNSSKLSAGQLKEAREAASNYRKGFSADGYPDEPPPEVVQKLSRISTQQRESINRVMIGLRNRGMGMEQRKKIYGDMLDKTLQNRR